MGYGVNVCAGCGKKKDEFAVVKDDWQICAACHRSWLAERPKVPWKLLREKLQDGLILSCGSCDRRLGSWTKRPASVRLSPDAEIEWVRCGTCIAAYREQQALKRVIQRLEEGDSVVTIMKDGYEERLVMSAASILQQQKSLFG